MARQVQLSGFTGTPIRRDRRKFAHYERLDVRQRRLLIVEVCSHISDVRIRQADDLSRITRVGENFLIAGQAGIKNDFATAPGNGSCGAAIKNSPIFERKNSLPCFCFRQWILFPAGSLLKQIKKSPHLHGCYFTDSAKTGIEPK